MTKDLPLPPPLVAVSTPNLTRQRKVETTAAAAAAMVAAAKAAKATKAVRLSSDPVLLGRDLIRRVDHTTIIATIDKHVLERTSTVEDSPSPLYTSDEDDDGDDAYSLFEKNQESPESLFIPTTQPNYTTHHRPEIEVSTPTLINFSKSTLSELHAMRRDAAVSELLATEESYCRDLDTLVNHFFTGIVDAKCVSVDEKQLLVRNGFAILRFQSMFAAALLKASTESLAEMVSRMTTYIPCTDHRVISIAKCFCEWGNRFEVYIDYCINHDKAVGLYKELTETNQAFTAVIDKLHLFSRGTDDGGNGRRMFDDYLIMPVQRLFKYKLILESILKTTQSESAEHTSLSRALIVMHEVAVRLNTKKSQMEAERKTRLFMNRLVSDWANASSKRFHGLLGSCLLIGTLDVRTAHGGPKVKRLGCALFSSCIIIAKAKRHDKYEPRHWFPLRVFDLEDVHSIFTHSWILRSETQSFEFTAMCEQEKQIWLDALQKTIAISRVPISPTDSIQQKASGSAVEELFGSSLGMQLSSASGMLQGFSSPDSLCSKVPQTERSRSLDPTQPGFSTNAPDTRSSVYRSAQSSTSAGSNTSANPCSPGLRTQPSFSDFYDFLSNTVADIRTQRRCHQNSLKCTNVDNKFEDVCTTPILTARSQVRADRNSGIDQWKRKSRMGKSVSMLVFASDADDERQLDHYSLVSSQNKAIVNSNSNAEAVTNDMRRKASLPSRLGISDSNMLNGRQPVLPSSSRPCPGGREALYQQQPWRQLPPQPPSSSSAPPVSNESMIFKLSRRGSAQCNRLLQQRKDANLHPTPEVPRSLSAATLGFARTSSRFLGRMVEKLGTIGTPGGARRYPSSGMVSHRSSQADGMIVHTRTRKRPIKKPPPLVIPVVPREQQKVLYDRSPF